MAITSVGKKLVIYLRAWIKLLFLFLIGLAIIGFIIFVVYKPMYSVSLDEKFIGYTENKRNLQKKISNYINSGDSKTVAFVEIDTLPEYRLCLLKKGLTVNDEEIFNYVISSGVPYYKYYAILDNGEEKYYVSTYSEAESVIQTLKEKNSKNKESITCIPKYDTVLKEFSDRDTIVASLYIETPVIKKPIIKYTPSNSSGDNGNVSLGVTLIEPVSGVITSRFGRRSSGQHTGLDIATSTGTPIKAAYSGKVVCARYNGNYGYLVRISHTNSIETYYAHCSKLYVTEGEMVSQGQVIAAVGSTGNSTGPHLHLEVRVNGVPKNPQYYVYFSR